MEDSCVARPVTNFLTPKLSGPPQNLQVEVYGTRSDLDDLERAII